MIHKLASFERDSSLKHQSITQRHYVGLLRTEGFKFYQKERKKERKMQRVIKRALKMPISLHKKKMKIL
jgi:hypothetical protein